MLLGSERVSGEEKRTLGSEGPFMQNAVASAAWGEREAVGESLREETYKKPAF